MDQERIKIPQEQQGQLTWTLANSQRLNHQRLNHHGLDLGPFTYVANMQLGLHAGRPKTGVVLFLPLLLTDE